MKPISLNKKCTSVRESFIINKNIIPQFYTIWHNHPEVEILYIEKDSGEALIGDTSIPFAANELMLYGPNLPHMFKPKLPNGKHPVGGVEAIVLHFPAKLVQSALRLIPEFFMVEALLKRSSRGLLFKNENCKKEASVLLKRMLNTEGYEKMLDFIRLLCLLAQQEEYDLIASQGYIDAFNVENVRLEKVYQYIFKHYKRSDITLAEVAKVANMNATAFSRYFKKVTQKTFIQFLNEVRIGYACKVLLEEKKSIAEVAFACGYNSSSNFNRQFKLIKQLSPSAYLKQRTAAYPLSA